MFFPIPFAFPQQDGPGTPYAQSRMFFFGFLLSMVTFCTGIRLCILLDIMGGFIDGIVCAMGWYALKCEMNITWLCYYAMMCLFQGVFGIIRWLDRYVHIDGPWLLPISFKSSDFFLRTLFYDTVQLSMLLSGVFMLLSVHLVYVIYQEFTTGATPTDALPTNYRSERTPLRANRPAAQATFAAFQGQGNKLGGDP
eukprot:gnl/MRDRNA2_/MRDRNA2_105012_c0_seq1.p1 gnl/MRDRNA2_/MRDRNA2_105012_c0~~gnl/MRDRNA2_/MRDRNA2_105012_c0_seq1.p1  ORF type:complete len:196 (-),score=17.82 gnl/MRDRNA2_/MRDRNA2_105012_c0_seq1:26-613(-)